MKTVVILIHGIRTRAEWQEKISEWLDLGEQVVVKPIGYGRFDAIRFLSPFFTRQQPIDILTAELDELDRRYPSTNWRRIVIAHSFGTYAITKILEARPSMVFDDLLLCGAIVSEKYDWIRISKQVRNIILNDCGRRDIWPVMAKSVTWGYGATGTFGIQSGTVTNRFHSFGHSNFFEKGFVQKFWRPFIRDSEIVPSHEGTDVVRSPWYFELLSIPLRVVLPLLMIVLLVPETQKTRFGTMASAAYVAAYEAVIGPYISEEAAVRFAEPDRLYHEENDKFGAAELYRQSSWLGNPIADGGPVAV